MDHALSDFELTPELIAATRIEPERRHGSRRICSRCGEPRDKAEFRILRHRLTGRMYFESCCKPCSKEKQKYRRRRRLEKAKQLQFREAVMRLKECGIKAPHVSEVWGELVNTYGGLQQFVTQYKAQIDAAVLRGAGSKVVLDAFKALTHLSVHSSNLQKDATDVALLTDADIENQLKMMTMRVIKTEPQMLRDMIASGDVTLPPEFTLNPDYADPHASPEVTRGEE
jgi:hypothetical protein